MLQGQFEVHREWVHRTARGERLLVMHGDQFDGPWLVPALAHAPGRCRCTASTVML